jgi:hypothetical protein
MLKISSWICGCFLIVWIILVVMICLSEPSLSAKDWREISITTVIIVVGSFSLSYFGGYIIKGNKGAVRLMILISILWVAGSFVVIEPYNRYRQWGEFVLVGLIPVISYLGILWVISGFIPSKKM